MKPKKKLICDYTTLHRRRNRNLTVSVSMSIKGGKWKGDFNLIKNGIRNCIERR